MKSVAYIALGSNLNNPRQQIDSAYQSIKSHPEIEITHYSSLYQSTALTIDDDEQQPDYINAVISVLTDLSALELLLALQKIETNHGRVRQKKWGARTLDLDILLFNNERIDTATLTIPHPEINNRNFVLLPLAEISEYLDIPGFGNINDLLNKISKDGIQKLEE